MKDEIRPVVCASIEPKQLCVGHVRDPGERSAGTRVRIGEGPSEVRRGDPGGDVGVFSYEFEIVVVHQVEFDDRCKHSQREKGDGQTDPGPLL